MYNFSNSKRWETLTSIMVGVIILAIAIWGVVMIMVQNHTIEEDYNKNNTLSILQMNSENIMRKINTSSLSEKDIFYLCKDSIAGSFGAFTGSVGEGCKYINGAGELVNSGTYLGTVYARIFTVERWDSSFGKPRQVIKWAIKELIRK